MTGRKHFARAGVKKKEAAQTHAPSLCLVHYAFCIGMAVLCAAKMQAADNAEAPPDRAITFDVKMPTYIDQSKSSSFPNLGYAGCIADEGPEYAEEFFRRSPDKTWEVFKGAGAYLVKEWNADTRWEQDKAMAYDVYTWRKKHGVKVLLCIEHYSGRTINDARRRILGFVHGQVELLVGRMREAPALSATPLHGRSTARPLVAALLGAQVEVAHANLVSVVDERHTRHGENKRIGKLQLDRRERPRRSRRVVIAGDEADVAALPALLVFGQVVL